MTRAVAGVFEHGAVRAAVRGAGPLRWDERTEFVPYWNLQGLATIATEADWTPARPAEEAARPGNPPLVMSLYRRPGKVMFVPFNNTDEDVAVTLTWEAGKLGIGEVRELEDYFTGAKVKAEGGGRR